jgi:hypothetical protein
MTQPLVVASLLIAVGLLGLVLPYRFNIFRLKRFAAVLLPERYHHMVPRIVGSLALLLGIVVGVLGLTVLRLDPRGFPVRFVNGYGKPLEWVALEHPKNVEVARGGPVAPGPHKHFITGFRQSPESEPRSRLRIWTNHLETLFPLTLGLGL